MVAALGEDVDGPAVACVRPALRACCHVVPTSSSDSSRGLLDERDLCEEIAEAGEERRSREWDHHDEQVVLCAVNHSLASLVILVADDALPSGGERWTIR